MTKPRFSWVDLLVIIVIGAAIQVGINDYILPHLHLAWK